jgi:hypothetical protein
MIAGAAVLSVAGIATANRAIRDNTINSRDIKNNQVNTRDLRDGSITTRDIRDNQINTRDLRDGALRGADVHDGSLGIEELDPNAVAYAGRSALFDPRSHDQDSDGNGAVDNPEGTVPGHVCCLSWALGPKQIDEVVPPSADPIPTAADGREWRSVTLDPGAYVVQTSGYAQGPAPSEGVASRLFLGGKPLAGGYGFRPASSSAMPVTQSQTTAFEVAPGAPGERRLTNRIVSIAGVASFADNLLIWEVTPR